MRNAQREEFAPNYSQPMSQGTRCHQLAMYVVYNQPLAMLCDSPTTYDKEPEYTAFLSSIPTTWASRKTISGKIGEHIVVECLSHDGEWYIAGLNGECDARTIEIELPVNVAEVEVYGDNDSDCGYRYERITTPTDKLSIVMQRGGGFVIKCKKR